MLVLQESRLLPRTRKHYIAPIDERAIGRKLRELRGRRGMTQMEVAAELGINQSLVSDYERGTVRLHSALLAGFAKVLKASADEILGIEKAPTNGTMIKDRRFVRRIEKIDRLPKRQRQILLGTIDAVLKSSGLS
jgi:transcriptional regulator with XRE-family HTH domain